MPIARLQILLRPLIDTVERLVKILHGIRHAEPQIAFAEFAECCSGKSCDSSLLQQRICQRLRLPSRLRDVREHIKRALRHAAGKAFDLVEAGYHHVPAGFELVAHMIDRTLISADGFDTRYLSKAGGA